MTTAQMNGLEYLTAIKNGELPGSAMGQLIPMKLSVVHENYVEYEVYPDERHFNLQGGIHGGFCATVLDSVTGAAVHTTVDAGVSFSTIGEVIRIGRNVLTSEGRIVDKDGKIYAFGSATLLVTDRK